MAFLIFSRLVLTHFHEMINPANLYIFPFSFPMILPLKLVNISLQVQKKIQENRELHQRQVNWGQDLQGDTPPPQLPNPHLHFTPGSAPE